MPGPTAYSLNLDPATLQVADRFPYAQDASSPGGPTLEEIANEAYLLYAARGFQDGYDLEDWLAAEDSLRRRTAERA